MEFEGTFMTENAVAAAAERGLERAAERAGATVTT